MELLKEIQEIDLGLAVADFGLPNNVRRAARIVLVNNNNQIAILYVSKDKYHKLPGGGIEGTESIQDALVREVREEVGARAEIVGEVGVTIEYRGQFMQISYCYHGRAIGEIIDTAFTDEEKSKGFELKWFDIDTAIEKLANDDPLNYVGKFIKDRDLCLLKRYRSECCKVS